VSTIVRPSWRGRLHKWAFFASLPAGLLLVLFADTAVQRTSAVIYVVGLLALFGTSAAYHHLDLGHRRRVMLQKLDHSMIFVLIAATYTPLCLLGLPRSWGIPLLVIAWTVAGVGITIRFAKFDRLRVLGFVLYPLLGWTLMAAVPQLARHLTGAQLALIIIGGVIYTVGIPVLVVGRPNPWPAKFGYHEVWHAFTVVAAACHFAAVGMLVSS
jgi:hemolysin III